MSTSIEIVRAALEGNAVELKKLFDQEVGTRSVAGIESMRPEVAAGLLGVEQPTAEEE